MEEGSKDEARAADKLARKQAEHGCAVSAWGTWSLCTAEASSSSSSRERERRRRLLAEAAEEEEERDREADEEERDEKEKDCLLYTSPSPRDS